MPLSFSIQCKSSVNRFFLYSLTHLVHYISKNTKGKKLLFNHPGPNRGERANSFWSSVIVLFGLDVQSCKWFIVTLSISFNFPSGPTVFSAFISLQPFFCRLHIECNPWSPAFTFIHSALSFFVRFALLLPEDPWCDTSRSFTASILYQCASYWAPAATLWASPPGLFPFPDRPWEMCQGLQIPFLAGRTVQSVPSWLSHSWV